MSGASASARVLVGYITAPAAESKKIAAKLVGDGLVACVNITSNVTSVYTWEGKVEESTEDLLMVKTTAARAEDVKQAVVAMHSYDCPEVIFTEVASGHAPYLDWVQAQTARRA